MGSGVAFQSRLNWARFAAVGFAATLATRAYAADPSPGTAQDIARALADATSVTVAGERLDGALVQSFYAGRQWQPAWNGEGAAILAVLQAAGDEGLSLRPFHIKVIQTELAKNDEVGADLLLTDALISYARALHGSRVDPAKIENDWFLPRQPFDPIAFLQRHQSDLIPALAGLEPTAAPYLALKGELARLHAIAAAGDWPKVPAGPPLHPGDSDPRIAALRVRLAATGEFKGDTSSPVLDADLASALKLFQQRRGLDDDGALGPRTVAELNLSPSGLAVRVALNMERWRELPRQFEPEHILVNVPAQSLELVEDNQLVTTMKVVVGDVDHPTPVMHASMVSLVFNPEWRVPASIATAEILPRLKQDPGYLIANDLELVSDEWPPGSPQSQGVGIDWRAMRVMPWPVRQLPGDDNALGRIKFNMPNDDDIYLHDTPERKLFARAVRAFSHGCVRVEDAERLALTLLQGKDGWDQSRLEEQIDEGETHSVALRHPVPVWLVYLTAWVDPDGVLETRDDLYGRDHRLSEALTQPPGTKQVASRATAKYCDGCRLP